MFEENNIYNIYFVIYHNFYFHNKFKIILKLLNGIMLLHCIIKNIFLIHMSEAMKIFLHLYLINTK